MKTDVIDTYFREEYLIGDGIFGAFIHKACQQPIYHFSLIQIEGFDEITIAHGTEIAADIHKQFCQTIAKFFSDMYALDVLGFGLFGLRALSAVALDEFVRLLDEFYTAFISAKLSPTQTISIFPSLRMGVASYHQSLAAENDWLKEAFCALLEAQNTHKHLCVFDSSQKILQNTQEKARIKKLLYESLIDGALLPYFQPIVDMQTGEISRYEALARIKNGNQTIYPKEFFKILKNTLVYVHTIKLLIQKSFDVLTHQHIALSINLNASDIENDDISQWLLQEITSRNLGADLIIEITEHEKIKDYKKFLRFIQAIKALGVGVAIDDFGCGYSNVDILMHIPVDFIKIDGSFITDIHQNPQKLKIVIALIAFAKSLHIATIAEFVSSEEIYAVLKSLGIDYAQGYFIGKPINFG
ncbi:hypothetical protein BKH46_06705 [Helicobacter sp. 12S02634-8]|uniref:EAL domain-containing protein n=1 Tax=Helicobacter sp. 12S02634-8 TaxID=1476199 RepID=UPI000BA766D3|nr:EAL domain-containing protein [Helicobacter sp. 12S02634-8]PAF46653.1 hypothetical protein BKH46_06705 [Helicobacter sp. 12S02634-8]